MKASAKLRNVKITNNKNVMLTIKKNSAIKYIELFLIILSFVDKYDSSPLQNPACEIL